MDFWYSYRGHVKKLWPRRLLDTITWESFERQEGDIYSGFVKPRYSIISYTWGRFELRNAPPEAPRLPVTGITWEIPAIDPEVGFSTDRFMQMIQRTREISGNRFIWLDVACIDQENYAVKMEEVGKQAGIFANAGVAFVWLWTMPTAVVRDGWTLYQRMAAEWHDTEGAEADIGIIEAVRAVFVTMLDDRWFSSLWTLQEERLRTDALLISEDGEAGTTSSEDVQFTLSFMHLGFNRIYRTLCMGQSDDVRIRSAADELRWRIKKAGYMAEVGTNPNLAFTSAHLRQATNELDRIYGIIALYNIRVGATVPGVDLKRRYTLDDLREEFVVALNQKSLYLGQLFVHVTRPAVTWKITQNARVPEGFDEWDDKFVELGCSLDIRPDGLAHIRGNITSFQDLVTFWHARLPQLTRVDCHYHLNVLVDDYVCQEHPALQSLVEKFWARERRFSHTQETVVGLTETFGSQRLSVVRLGGTTSGPGRPDIYGEFHGLLILHDEDNRARCQRIGICRWEGDTFRWQVSQEVLALNPTFAETYEGEIY
ncbi:hypothetical protein N0V82_005161 [Gnomoniopsis sp. IMI 355080]|nr:hypothetical protein N0V82_005161 [Gnomoniopsis sp. IMI 355080]